MPVIYYEIFYHEKIVRIMPHIKYQRFLKSSAAKKQSYLYLDD